MNQSGIIDFLREIFAKNRNAEAIVWRDQSFAYGWLLDRIDFWRERLAAEGVPCGAIISIESDFSPEGVALFLALLEHSCVLVPLTAAVSQQIPDFVQIAQTEFRLRESEGDASIKLERTEHHAGHSLYRKLRESNNPGLVLFSSGSTGTSKAAVHDLSTLLEKFKTPRRSLRAITFLLYDHIGGVNTMLYTLANAGCMVTVRDRAPDTVLAAIAKHRVELLPTSPTFLNLILLSQAWQRHDLSTLRTVTYGTEPMPESTLKNFHRIFPDLTLQQTYGLSEVGILRSKSKSSDSLWMKIGGEGFQTRVVDGLLEIKAQSAMLGYLNAPSPFTADGWFITGDAVETDGDYLRILGRKSEIINVGGEKVYPSEVESVLLQIPGVVDATVSGQSHPITGSIVAARFNLETPETLPSFRRRMRDFCRERLAPYKIPAKIEIVDSDQFSARYKKMRRVDDL